MKSVLFRQSGGLPGGTAPLIILIGVMVGGNFTIAKAAVLSGIPAFALYYWQLLAACFLLLAVIAVKGEKLPMTGRYLRYYLLNGLLGSSLPQIIAYTALEHVPAGVFTVLITFSPLFTFLVSSTVERRLLPLVRLTGIMIGLAGISLATLNGFDPGQTGWYWLLFALTSPLFLAVNNVYRAKAYPKDAKPLPLAAGSLLIQSLLLWPALIWSGQAYQPLSLTDPADAGVLALGVITAISYILTFALQRHTDGLGFSQVGYFVTLSGIVLGALFFDEELSPGLIGSVLLLFLGLALTNGHISLSFFTRKRS